MNLLKTIFLIIVIAGPALSAEGNNNPANIALSGYDVVSYFTKNEAEKGDAHTSYTYESRTYYFSSEGHRKLFVENPEKYLPQYDGYCAYGVTFGKKLEASPEAWKIVNGKLYLNLNKKFLAGWEKDISNSILEGDDQWALIQDIPASDL